MVIQKQTPVGTIKVQGVVAKAPTPAHIQNRVRIAKSRQTSIQQLGPHYKLGIDPIHQGNPHLISQTVPTKAGQGAKNCHVHCTPGPYSRVASRVSSTSPALGPDRKSVV